MKKISTLTFLLVSIICQVSCSRTADRIAALEETKDTVKPAVNKPTTISQTSKLPKLNLTNLDGTVNDMSAMVGKRLVFVLFQPDCEHCQNEAKQFFDRVPKFSKYEVYFISSAPAAEIKKFSVTYKLDKVSNFHFVATDVSSVIDNYGPIQAPSIFVYNAEGNLENKFEGEMELDVVLQYL